MKVLLLLALGVSPSLPFAGAVYVATQPERFPCCEAAPLVTSGPPAKVLWMKGGRLKANPSVQEGKHETLPTTDNAPMLTHQDLRNLVRTI